MRTTGGACRLVRRTRPQMLLYVLPLVVLLGILTGLRFRDAFHKVQETNLELAGATAVAFENYLDQLWEVEEALGNAFTETSSGPEIVNRLFVQQLYACPSVRNYILLDPHGRVLAASNPRALQTTIADRRCIQELMRGQDSVVSDLLVGRVSGEPILLVGRAIRQRTRLLAMVVATVDVSKLAAEVPSRLGKANVGLVDAAGRLVYVSQYPKIPFGRRLLRPDAPAWQALAGRVGKSNRIVSETDVVTRVGVAVPIPSLGWAAIAGVPRSEALIPAYQTAAFALLGFLAVIGATLIGVLLPQRQLINHSRALSQAAAALAEGDYRARVQVSGSSDLAHAEAAFNHMARRIQELEHDRLRFIQSAAHELRTPMTSVKAVCDLLQRDLSVNPRTAGLARILAAEVTHLSGLVNDILDSFLLQEDRLKLDLKPLNLVDVVNSSLGSLRAAEPDRFSVRVDTDPVMVHGDRKRLAQVLRNLFGNAVKYSASGTPIRVAVSTDGPSAVVSVADQGRGIPADQIHKVFEPFFRASNVEHTSGLEGIGLGLNLCRDVVERHGGRVWVESQEGVGSTFCVSLPLLPPDEPSH